MAQRRCSSALEASPRDDSVDTRRASTSLNVRLSLKSCAGRSDSVCLRELATACGTHGTKPGPVFNSIRVTCVVLLVRHKDTTYSRNSKSR